MNLSTEQTFCIQQLEAWRSEFDMTYEEVETLEIKFKQNIPNTLTKSLWH